jgi:N6-L-threonylcarbamoyladenine synthase
MIISNSNKNPIILAIDTSCDETSVAITKGRRVLSNVVSSQVELHKKWGGVVPDISRRAHIEELPGTYKEALSRAKMTAEDIEAVAVTIGPGLAIDLEIGLQFAKDFANTYKVPFIPVNHMEGHLMSGLLLNSQGNGRVKKFDNKKHLPALAMLISGKHTEIIYFEEFGKYKKLGWTLDDAAGEAFDKVARMLNLGYPGGEIVEEFSKKGKYGVIELPIPMAKSKDMNFSYSGLKTAALYKLKKMREEGIKDKDIIHDFAKSFVNSVAVSLTNKLKMAFIEKAEEDIEIKALYTGGGVSQNQLIIRRIGDLVKGNNAEFVLPDLKFRGDNASMIGIAGWRMFNDGQYLTEIAKIAEIERIPRYSIEDIA